MGKLSKRYKSKANVFTGFDNWNTEAVEELGLPSVMMTDGPHGLRKQIGGTDAFDLGQSVPATCFPTAVAVACSFDTKLIEEMGQALGEECRKENVGVLLGPGLNIKRNPLCGRSFEYLSEDPLLSGKMAAALVNGIQSRGVGACLKHFAANNQEYCRMICDSQVDERALREIYLRAFEIAIKESHPWTIMVAYNKINGTYATSNQWLLEDVGRKQFGFDGLYVSDWGAMDDCVASFNAGLDLEMPGTSKGRNQRILKALDKGYVSEETFVKRYETFVELLKKCKQGSEIPYECDFEKHHKLAVKVAENCSVLLKNQGELLPLKSNAKVALIGEMAKVPRYQGAGSSRVNPRKLDSICDAFDEMGIRYSYAKGYASKVDEALIAQAVDVAQNSDVAILVCGLPNAFESEGYDRQHLNMPQSHIRLIEEVSKVNSNVIVVLQCGATVNLAWENNAKSILLAHLSGEGGGKAIANLLFGKVSPCGRLAETWCDNLDDIASTEYFHNDDIVEYRESIFVGYRWFTKANKKVRYPFGYGLSYGKFAYSNLTLEKSSLTDTETITVSVDVKNVGSIAASEVVQLYVAPQNSKTFKAVRELKAFTKVYLAPSETQTVQFVLDKSAFEHFDLDIKQWIVESGNYKIEICRDADTVILDTEVQMLSSTLQPQDNSETLSCYYKPNCFKKEQYLRLLGHKLPSPRNKEKPWTLNNPLGDAQDNAIVQKILAMGQKSMDDVMSEENFNEVNNTGALSQMPIRSLTMGGMSKNKVEGLLLMINGKKLKALFKMMKK